MNENTCMYSTRIWRWTKCWNTVQTFNRHTHSWSWAFLEKPPCAELFKNFPAFYGTGRLITVFTRVLRLIQSIPSHPLSKIYFNIAHSPTFWSSQWSLTFWLPHQYLTCIPLRPLRVTSPAHLNLLDVIILIMLGEYYKLWSCSLCSFHRPSCQSKYSPQHPVHRRTSKLNDRIIDNIVHCD
jgi:hypothetical protein